MKAHDHDHPHHLLQLVGGLRDDPGIVTTSMYTSLSALFASPTESFYRPSSVKVCPSPVIERYSSILLNPSDIIEDKALWVAGQSFRFLINNVFALHDYTVITYSRVWINRVRLPVLLVVS